MSDTSKTPESKTYKPILYVHPFYPTFSIKEAPEEAPPIYQVRFNQAYVYDHQNDIIHPPIEISGMSSTFQIGDEKAKKFYVSLSLDEGRAVDAALMETEDNVPASSEDAKYFLVCEIKPDLTIGSFKLRENIHWGLSKPSVLTDLNTATYKKRIAKHNNGIKDAEDVNINETITRVEPSDDGFIYTDEAGGDTEIEFPKGAKSVMTDYNSNGHKIATHNDGGAGGGFDTDINETVTSIAVYGGNTQTLSSDYFTYIDERGDETQVFFPQGTKSVITPESSSMDVNKIATHNDGTVGGDTDINETVTTVVESLDGFTYTDEAGDHTEIAFPDAEDILPAGSTGDIIYYNGVAWVTLAAPTPAELAAFYGDPVLHHDGTAPYWGQDDYYL